MRHDIQSIGQSDSIEQVPIRDKGAKDYDFVLEKNIFSNVFEKDIRRVFIYKKAERLAKAIHLVAPAFRSNEVLHGRLSGVAIALVDAAIESPHQARTALSRELLVLSSVLAVARTSGLLSPMNADLISREAQQLLQEVASYEEPQITLDTVPTVADLARVSGAQAVLGRKRTSERPNAPAPATSAPVSKGRIKDRRESVLSVIRAKGQVSIKDITHLVRGVSEKTIQRELGTLVAEGVLEKQGERRWSTYRLA
jgi:DNA-binding transcriptional ArsR family regulator